MALTQDLPGAVQDVADSATSDTVTITWSAPNPAGRLSVEGYIVTSSAGPATTVAATTATMTGLAAGQTYSFEVRAFNALASGAPVTVSATTASPEVETVAAQPASPSGPPLNYLRAEDGSISTPVGAYYSLSQPVPTWEAVLDYRMTAVPYYFDGHNPGVFTPLLSEHAGSVIDYWNGRGQLLRFRIISIRSWVRTQGEPPPVSGAVVAQFQTCRVPDGSVDWIYDAVPA